MEYIYYMFYRFILLTPSKKEQPEHIANMVVALIFCLNIFVLVSIFEYYFDISFIKELPNKKIMFAILYMITLVVGYFVFIKNKRYVTIKEKYNQENKSKKVLKTTLALIYIIAVFFLAFLI